MIRKLKSKLNNRGSSFVMLVVTVAFLSVLATSILVAVGFSYQLKVYNLNSRNNFYYVEQALDEIYAGVGNIAVNNLRQAYADTLEILIYYDPAQKEYVPMKDSDANLLMRKTFMQYMKDDPALSTSVVSGSTETFLQQTLKSYNTNPDVDVVVDNATLDVTGVDQVVIRNVTVKRAAKYSGGNATGDYIQSITTDIVVGEPDYNVSFSTDSAKYSAIYDFALVADAGVEVTGATSQVNVSGNVYAAADFYNKEYQAEKNGTTILTNTYTGLATDVSAYQKSEDRYKQCDGLREQSMYSGFYINAAHVILQSSNLIVPGSLAVFNGAQLVVSAKENGSVVPSEMWVDNIDLGGYTPVSGASRADIYANAHVYDDLTMDADGASLKMQGEYYGYNYSHVADNRTFLDPAKSNYQNADGDNINDHYNSSSIILNGQDTKLDFVDLDKLYIAGRSYIEMSKKVSKNETELSEDETVETKTYTYDNTIKDYITGESLSVKSNQVAYMPIKTWNYEVAANGKVYFKVPANVKEPYEGFFSQLSKVPVIKQTVSGTDFYFFDFNAETDASGNPIYKNVDKTKFIQTYAEFFEKDDTATYSNSGAKYLKDITDYTRFQVNSIALPDDTSIYSNGALTVKDETTFSIKASQDSLNVFTGLSKIFEQNATSSYINATRELSSEYNMIKYVLTIDSTKKADVDTKVNTGTDITPLESYFNVAAITDLAPNGKDLGNGYKIWVSDGDIEISDATGSAQGIVLAKGDVTFAPDMTTFRGLIVSGSKIYINHTMNFFADATIAKSAIQQCKLLSDSDGNAKDILQCFREITDAEEENTGTGGGTGGTGGGTGGGSDSGNGTITSLDKMINEVSYDDVLSFSNWKKNVE